MWLNIEIIVSEYMRILILTFILLLLLTACNPNPPSVLYYENLPAGGDVARGEELFNTAINSAPPCSACHIPNSPASPDLAGLAERAASRVEGQEAQEYIFYSIVEPARYIVDGYGNVMWNQYDESLSAQDIADLISYLLSL